MDRTIHYFQDNGKIGKLEIPDNLIFSKIRDPGCRGSIRLVKTVCLLQISDFIIIKIGPKSNFYMKFVENHPNSTFFQINLIIRFVGYLDRQGIHGVRQEVQRLRSCTTPESINLRPPAMPPTPENRYFLSNFIENVDFQQIRYKN